jgi:DNA polymerase I-like protein with 3'-5' exonuclease and polymerase domains
MQLVYNADPILKAIKKADTVVVDTETSSLFPWRDGKILAGIGVKPLGGEGFYLPVRHKNSRKQAPIKELKRLCEALRGKLLIFHNQKFDLGVLYQEGIDLVDENIIDTVVLIRLVSEDEPSYELERLAKKYVDPNAMEGKRDLRAFMKKMGYVTYDQIPDEYIYNPYVCNDLRFPEGLYTKAMPFIEKRGLGELLKLEQELTRKLFRMEECGFQLDRDYVLREFKVVSALVEELEEQVYKEARKALRKRAKELKMSRVVKPWLGLTDKSRVAEIKAGEYTEDEQKLLTGMECLEDERKVSIKKTILAGTFDVHSPHDVRKIFEALGIRSDTKTKKGGASWAKTALAVIDHPMAELVVRIRGSSNVRNYYENFLELMDPNNVIHCSFHQAGTRTGRLSCREPNLQNIPRFEAFTGATTGAIASMKRLKKKQEERDTKDAKDKKKRYAEAGRTQISFEDATAEDILSEFEGELFGKVRGAFVPRPGYFLLSIDWKQIELRIFADYAEEIELLRTFDLGLDVHRMTALAAFGSLPDPKKNAQMYKWVRNMGKQIAFGLLYGMGITLLAIEIGRSKDEAQTFMDRYFARFKNARRWIDDIHVECENEGFVFNLWGRRRYLPKKVVYKAVNFMVQGTAADLMKDAIVRVYDRIEKFATRLLITVHDELVFEVPYEEAEEVIPVIIEEMQKCDRIKAKLRCDVAWAPDRWSQMYEDEYAELCDLSCGGCKGKGQVVTLPGVSADTLEDVLLKALYENNKELLATATIADCEECDNRGYDLSKIKEPVVA